MQFQIPQFIEVEDKIFGPLTFKQFIYLAGALGSAFIAWRLFPLYIAIFVIMGVGGLGAALALFEWNGRPFILGLEYGFYYLINTKLYLWSHERKQKKAREALKENKKVAEVYVPRLSDSKLHDLAWSLDIKEKVGQVGIRDFSAPGMQLQPRATTDALAAVHTAKEAVVR
ncbi:PrgI family protein [Candidatus Kaiserbacteria bacterium]|nr:PrgI family protein [Candidatus Kaiserbacteria bacterium]